MCHCRYMDSGSHTTTTTTIIQFVSRIVYIDIDIIIDNSIYTFIIIVIIIIIMGVVYCLLFAVCCLLFVVSMNES